MVRLKPGVGIARAQADFDLIARDLADTYADHTGRGLKLSELWRAPSRGGPAVTRSWASSRPSPASSC